jgi:hypothetical protein
MRSGELQTFNKSPVTVTQPSSSPIVLYDSYTRVTCRPPLNFISNCGPSSHVRFSCPSARGSLGETLSAECVIAMSSVDDIIHVSVSKTLAFCHANALLVCPLPAVRGARASGARVSSGGA